MAEEPVGGVGPLAFDEQGVSLPVAIAQLRAELSESIQAGQGERLQFAVETIEVDLEVTINSTRKAEAKASMWRVLSVGGSRERAEGATHRVKLVLKPRDADRRGETVIGDDT
jgi:hypothetical protein